tara:strand:- start:31544 stop:33259 length:1716 start_codon:yes stop_codon:yes gene_type:complete
MIVIYNCHGISNNLIKNFTNNKFSNFAIIGVLTLFLLIQIRFIYIGGTTYDADGLRFGSSIILEKVQRIISFNTDFNDLPFTNVEYYGMFVILPAYIFSHFFSSFINNPLDFGYYNIDGVIYLLMNLYLVVYVTVCLFFISKKLQKLINFKTATLFLLLIILTPSFSGHSLFNHKDIPYSLQLFLFAVYFVDYIKNSYEDKIEKNSIYKLGILLGLTLGVRVNAIFFVSLLILIGIIYLIINKKLLIRQLAFDLLKIYLVGFILLYIISPSAWVNPGSWLVSAIQQQFLHNWSGSTLTNGEFVIALDMEWDYLIKWFFYKLPIIFHISIFLYIYLKYKDIKLDIITEFSAVFILSVFFVFALIKPAVYDGLRQFLFLIPFFAIFSTDVYLKFIETNGIKGSYLIAPIFFYLIFTQYGLGSYRYVYFNEFVNLNNVSVECNNIDGCGTWPTDYWGYSGKEIAEYINKNILNGEIPEKSNFAWNGNYTSLLICRPHIATSTYLDKGLNINKLNTGDYSRREFFTVTFHRPRFNDDSCKLLVNNIDYSCRPIYKLKKNLRFTEIDLAYINECKI